MKWQICGLLLVVLTFGCSEEPTSSQDLRDRDLLAVVRVETSKTETEPSIAWSFEEMIKQWDSVHTSSLVQGILDSLCHEAKPLLVIESGWAEGYLYKAWVISGCRDSALCLTIVLRRSRIEPEVSSRRLDSQQLKRLEFSMSRIVTAQGIHSELSDRVYDGSREIVSLWGGKGFCYFLSTGLRSEQHREGSTLRWLSALADTVFWSQERTRDNGE